jgi:predicted RND superfamily exporter protein
VIARVEDFDRSSGSRPERLLFNHRLAVLAFCGLATLLLGFAATRLRVNALFSKMIPTGHPYVANDFRHRADLQGLANVVRVAVETRGETVFTAPFLERLRQINDEIFLLPGVDRPYMRSLWTPATRWIAVSEEGLEGGPVIPDGYDGSPQSLEQVRANVEQSGEIGHLVASDLKSAVLVVPLLDRDPGTQQRLDYGQFARRLEEVRRKHQSADVILHITGFAKLVGDLIQGLWQMVGFFAIAVVITSLVLFGYTRSLRNALLVVACSLTAVIWLLGLLAVLGRELDPYSILVPFLIFAIGVSHGAQKMNGIAQDIGRGTHKLVAARYTFRRLFLTGLSALMAAAAGFAVLMVVPIQNIRDLAMTASLGVAMLVITNLVMLPVLLSFVGVSPRSARRSLVYESPDARHHHWALRLLVPFTRRPAATIALGAAAMMAVAALAVSARLQVGDLDPGAPELARKSPYNRDSAFMTSHYGASSDVFVVMVETAQYRCAAHRTLMEIDALEARLQQLPGVRATSSLAGLAKRFAVGMNEGNPKWYDLPRTEAFLNAVAARAPRELMNYDCSFLPIYLYLDNHKADTLARVVKEVEAFARRNNDADHRFLLAAGNAGIEAATNIVVGRAKIEMLALVFAVILSLCLLTFRSWRAVVCAALPLALSALFCEALMVLLGIGVKVATLPVIAVGVGVGVDYALYLISVNQTGLRRGLPLSEAYRHALLFTGKVVVLAAITLGLAVFSWAFSPIKFQADMGVLLGFMFVWNMVGTLVLVPAAATFLLRSAPRGVA